MDSPSKKKKSSCGCKNSSDYTNLWPILKPIGSHAVSYAFEREKEGTVQGDIETLLCECILCNIYGEVCSIPENIPRFLKSVVHIPEERHLGLASLYQNLCYIIEGLHCILIDRQTDRQTDIEMSNFLVNIIIVILLWNCNWLKCKYNFEG